MKNDLAFIGSNTKPDTPAKPKKPSWAFTETGWEKDQKLAVTCGTGSAAATIPYGPSLKYNTSGWHFPGREWFTTERRKAEQWAIAIHRLMVKQQKQPKQAA